MYSNSHRKSPETVPLKITFERYLYSKIPVLLIFCWTLPKIPKPFLWLHTLIFIILTKES